MNAAGDAHRWRFEAIGTHWEIETVREMTTRERDVVSGLIDGFDQEWSRFRADSVVTGVARGGHAQSPPDAADMMSLYVELGDATQGAVNPLVGNALSHLGYGAAHASVPRAGGALGVPAQWQEIVHWDAGRLRVDAPGALIDVGALGKGRLVDRVLARVRAMVDGAIIVDASGDLAVDGRVIRVGLEHPYSPDRVIGTYELSHAALCASATNRRAWGNGLHHVLDARTGVPVRTIAATWAIHPEAMRADAAATALFFDGGAELAARWGVDWVRMTTTGRVEWAPDTRAEIF